MTFTMLSAHLLTFFGLMAIGASAPSRPSKRAQTIYLAGDSTMAKTSGSIQGKLASFSILRPPADHIKNLAFVTSRSLMPLGWGVYLPYSLSTTVNNQAIGGRSARSFTVEGRFDSIISAVQPNDIVVIEFGHNDGGSLSTDNGRTDCPGAGNETCTSTYNGKQVTVLTYPAYLFNAGKAMIAKGAKVIVSSPTPNNPWEGGTFTYSPSRFTTYSKDVVSKLGENAQFIDHGTYTANIFKTYGKTKTDALFPNDHTHTSPVGADDVARTFVKAVLCSKDSFLSKFLKNTTDSVEGTCV
jgi:rhamnogalacturonan acetylesterase